MPRPKSPRGFAENDTPYQMKRGDDGVAERRLPPPEELPNGTVRHFLKLGPKGRVLLPADLRQALGLGEGDLITAWLRDGELRLHSHLHGLRKIQDEASSLARGSACASDELIAERRAEAAKESEEALLWLRQNRKRKRRR
jgi:bifunctional DNA-binding transcriptional regulator/antitoxin component of YhaV-PrlF toxin-antitoxin module